MRRLCLTRTALLLAICLSSACSEPADGTGDGENTSETTTTADSGDAETDSVSSSVSSGGSESDSGDGDGDDETTGDGDADGELPPPLDAARIVFSGHSLMDAAVPTVRFVAEGQGDDLVDIFQTIPGSPIRVRTRGGSPVDENSWEGYASGTQGVNLVDELRSPALLAAGESYDTLVITDRHDLLGVLQWESTTSLLRHFHDRLLEGNADGQTYLYHSWLDVDKSNPQVWLDYERDALMAWECVSTKINLTLESDALPMAVRTIPAGWALTNMVEAALAGDIAGLSGSQQELLDAIFSDNVHLTPLGSHFIGSFTYASVFHKSPEGGPVPDGLSAETASALEAFAWQEVQAYASRPDGGAHSMETCRAHVSDTLCPQFWGDMLGEPQNVSGCQSYFGSEDQAGNPLRWPDPELTVWPVP